MALDGYTPLDPTRAEDFRRYINRPTTEASIVREALSARINKRPFLWFYTGHTGAGKSTELNRLRENEDIKKHYFPLYVNVENEFDLPNLEYTDLILAMARACAKAANEQKCKLSKKLVTAIENWGKEIIVESEEKTRTEGTGGIKVDLVFLKLGEEVKSGGEKRTLIREKMYKDITTFIRHLDELADALRKHTKREPLCILDGLDHADPEPCRKALCRFYSTVVKPTLSKVFVIPLYLLHDREFAPSIGDFHSTLENIKVYRNPEDRSLDQQGFDFFTKLIERYARRNLFSVESLESLFELSAGIVRDMIRFTGDACGYAAEAGAETVECDSVEKVWNREMARMSRLIGDAEVQTLEKIEKQPHPRGVDGVEMLLHRKAVIYYPNGAGWYGVHPVLRRYYQLDKVPRDA